MHITDASLFQRLQETSQLLLMHNNGKEADSLRAVNVVRSLL